MASELFSRLRSRYKDAYMMAKVIVGAGTLIKGIGVVFGIITVLAVVVGGSNSSDRSGGGLIVIVGLLSAAIQVGFFYVIGTIVSSQGQILRATLDSAVNTSPHIDTAEKAEIMALSQVTSEQSSSSTDIGGGYSRKRDICRVCEAKLTWSDKMNSEENLCKTHRHSHATPRE